MMAPPDKAEFSTTPPCVEARQVVREVTPASLGWMVPASATKPRPQCLPAAAAAAVGLGAAAATTPTAALAEPAESTEPM